MSSNNFNKKSDDKNDKAEQQALKEAEIVAELAPNEKTRKVEKLIETVENESTSVQEQEQEAIETVLDETKRAINKTVNEAKREIPKYTQAIGQLQEETIQTTKEIGYDCIELQREAANLIPKLQERYLSYAMPWMSPTLVTEYYSRMVDNFVDNAVSTRMQRSSQMTGPPVSISDFSMMKAPVGAVDGPPSIGASMGALEPASVDLYSSP